MARGSRFSTVLNWFREADPDEVRAIMPLVIEACGHRKITFQLMKNVDFTPAPRKRRTKAEMVASRLNGPEQTAAGAAA